ncbi:MAG: dihydroorotate dehydrogenase electron transfer subunit [Lachnospiraceae bacterium]|nr:dihydroorotate dehydrogenase electron transfer subunit [Lachnospiraceae bacterium]
MKQQQLEILSNEPLAAGIWRMVLLGDTSDSAPGRFAELRLPGEFYLRRPISVCDAREDRLTLVYKTVGRGTRRMTELVPGQEIEALTGLGNGFDLSRARDGAVLAGGGVGCAPLFLLARRLREAGCPVTAVLGFNRADEIFYEEEFRALGVRVEIATLDGSRGTKGFVTDAMPGIAGSLYVCGPQPMMKAVWRRARAAGQYSLEERMGCGFGVCMGCSIQTAGGSRRVCADGPVFAGEELLWND